MNREIKWFVMLNQWNNWPTPLLDREEDVALFDSFAEAEGAGESNDLGQSYGFVVYRWNPEDIDKDKEAL